MNANERERALRVAQAAAREAGEILMEHFGRLTDRDISSKRIVRDLITAADLASERRLVEVLRRELPECAIEAEEEVHDEADERPRWFVDPLDGTINFVHQLPCFAVSLGLFHAGQPEVAVVHAPRLEETYTAVRGGGAFLNGVPIRVRSTERLEDAILATGFPYARNEVEHSNLENFERFFYEVRGIRRMGAASVDLCFVAAGRFDGYWELHLAPHDVAAGALVVREAGGRVTDADGGEDWLRGGHIVAAGPRLHEAIRSRIVH